jgi:hypothetical protein
LILRLPLPSYLQWAVVAAVGAATVLSFAILAEYFPKQLAGRANGALNLFHIAAAFVVQAHRCPLRGRSTAGPSHYRTSTTKVGNQHTCGSPELWGDSGSYELGGIARFRFRLNTHLLSVVANGGIAGGSHEYQANPGSTSRLSQSHRSN